MMKKRKSFSLERNTDLIIPKHLPLVESGHSLKPDLKFGWKPTFENLKKAPKIPLRFNYEEFMLPEHKEGEEYGYVVYKGPRPNNSLELHEYLAIKTGNKSVEVIKASVMDYYKEFMR